MGAGHMVRHAVLREKKKKKKSKVSFKDFYRNDVIGVVNRYSAISPVLVLSCFEPIAV